MFISLCVQAADLSPLGRCDVGSLSDQTRMEIMFSDITDIARLQDEFGRFLDACMWKGVICDPDGRVIAVNMDESDLIAREMARIFDLYADPTELNALEEGGLIHLHFFPLHVHSFRLHGLAFEGTIDTTQFPSGLRNLKLMSNALSGIFSIEGLPKGICTINVADNKLTGSLNIPALPSHFEALDVSRNQFSGSLDLSRLPDSIICMNFWKNAFSGDFAIPFLPYKLESISLTENAFNGTTIVIGKLNSKLRHIDLDQCFRGKVVDSDGHEYAHAKIRFFDERLNDPLLDFDDPPHGLVGVSV